MRHSKKIGILNTILCFSLLVFILVFVQMNQPFREGADSSENKGVYFFNSFTCTKFNLTQDGGFECDGIVSNDSDSSSDGATNPLGDDVGGVYYFKSFSCDDYTISQDGGMTCNQIIMNNTPSSTGSS